MLPHGKLRNGGSTDDTVKFGGRRRFLTVAAVLPPSLQFYVKFRPKMAVFGGSGGSIAAFQFDE